MAVALRQKRTPIVELVSIGTELVQGERGDDNSPYLAKELAGVGLVCHRFTVVADLPLTPLVRAIREASQRSDLLILSGGLGPTDDDLTREAVAKALGRKLLFSPSLLEGIRKNFRRRGVFMPSINARQAYLPKRARAIPNPLGSAPGILLEHRKKILVVLPGVPKELRAMFQQTVRPYLKKRFPRATSLPSIRLRTTGLPESHVNARLEDLIQKENQLTFGFYAHGGIVDIKLMAQSSGKEAKESLRRTEREIRRRFGPFIFGKESDTLESVVFSLLKKRKKTISVGESCTGGALSTAFTRIPGSSDVFRMGVVAYGNDTKISVVRVPEALIRRHGAVSEPVAKSLAEQARRAGKTDFGLGVTGILGPAGGSRKKPVGLVHIALATPKKTHHQKCLFAGDRETIRVRVVRAALEMTRRALLR